MRDEEFIEYLLELDDPEEYEVTPWEAEFINSVAYDPPAVLSDKQRVIIEGMLEKFGII